MQVIVRHLGRCAYQPAWEAMQAFTHYRNAHTPDEIWIVEHPPTFTQGLAGKPEHLKNSATSLNIPIIQTDRGGQVTYHGPGQLVVYILIDLKRNRMGIRSCVNWLEQAIIQLLTSYNIPAQTNPQARGVYTAINTKICSIGLRVKKQCTYHGLALNVNMDLTPFNSINPCGFKTLKMTQMADWFPQVSLSSVTNDLILQLCKRWSSKL